MALRVLIAGGGLGGLTLAHGLLQAGIDVAVFEGGQRASDPTASYRIHIDANGSRALQACLPPDVWQLFTARSGLPPRGIGFATEHLRRLTFIPMPDAPDDPLARSHPIGRTGLRQLLLNGLEDVVTFDKRVAGYSQSADGHVDAHFADGSTARGDVLVGADGSNSAVRAQLLPGASVVDTGAGGIAGKLYLTPSTRDQLPPELLSQMTMILPARGLGMFLATFLHQPGADPDENAEFPEHLFWVLLAPSRLLGLTGNERRRPAAELKQLVLEQVEPWHPLLRRIVAGSDPGSIVGVPLHTARPAAEWVTTNVTLLGDAIHTMPPLQGLGGNTALRDAAALSEGLIDVERGRSELLPAIAAYETKMRDYGFEAVRRSVQVSDAVATTNIFGRITFRTVLRAADGLPALHRKLFTR